MIPERLIFLDVETTGSNPQRDRVTEIALCPLVESVPAEDWSSLIDPETPISPFIEQLTGISSALLADAPTFADLAMDLKERLEGAGGHLFQNRYKSIVCEEKLCLLELVRYLHLTPLCAGLVPDMAALSRYRWCGYSVLLRPAGSAASATKKKPAGHQSAQRPLLLRRARNGDKRGAGGTNAQHQPRGGELCRWPRGGLVAAVPRLWEMFGSPFDNLTASP